jgi:hypothetical protein
MRMLSCRLPVLILLRCLAEGFRPSPLTNLITNDRIRRDDRDAAAAWITFGSSGRRRRRRSRRLFGEGGESSWSLMVGEEGSWRGPPKITSEEVRARFKGELGMLRQKDRQSRQLLPEVRRQFLWSLRVPTPCSVAQSVTTSNPSPRRYVSRNSTSRLRTITSSSLISRLEF